MPVPSYDDLTPSIPDVHPRDTFDQVTQLVGSNEPVVTCRPAFALTRYGEAGRADVRTCVPLFACVRTKGADPAALVELARDFSPRVERHGDACVVLDVSGLGRLLGDAHGIGAELVKTASERRLDARVAIAPTQTAALVLSLCGSCVVTDAAVALQTVPIDTLGELAGPSKVLEILKRWGIRAIGELAALPADDLFARFGHEGTVLHRLARGIDARPLVPDPGVIRFVQSIELEWPIEELEPLSFIFARLLDPLSAALERADRAAAAIRLDLRLVDRTTHSRMLMLPAPMRDPRVLRTLLLLDLESHPPSAGIDTVAIEIDPAPSRIVQYSLLERAVPSPETLATLTARLNALVGESRCGSPALLDSHRPDAFEMRRFNPADAGSKKCQTAKSTESLVLRRFRPPIAVRVAVDRGRPVHVANVRKGVPNGSVEQAAGPWRSSGSWWDASGEHWDRDEWDVALSDGSVCRLHLDRTTRRWFIDAVFD